MSKEMNIAIGALVKRLRKEYKMTQVDMGKVLGIDQSALSRLEHGGQALTAAQWVTLSTHLALPGDHLTLSPHDLDWERVQNEVDQTIREAEVMQGLARKVVRKLGVRSA